jgi:hypothetical protein
MIPECIKDDVHRLADEVAEATAYKSTINRMRKYARDTFVRGSDDERREANKALVYIFGTLEICYRASVETAVETSLEAAIELMNEFSVDALKLMQETIDAIDESMKLVEQAKREANETTPDFEIPRIHRKDARRVLFLYASGLVNADTVIEFMIGNLDMSGVMNSAL